MVAGRAGVLCLALLGCPTEPTPGPAQTPTPPIPGATADTGVPKWTGAAPRLSAPMPLRDTALAVRVHGCPAAAEVTLLRAGAMGEGPCYGPNEACTLLADPQVVDTATADNTGAAELSLPPSSTLGAVFLQAVVVDPATGAAAATRVAQRQVSVPAADAAVAFAVHEGLPLPGGRVPTDGNSHTGGSAWIDYNGDLWPDLFVANGGITTAQRWLFRNDGDGTFTDVSDASGVRKAGTGLVDADCDGVNELDAWALEDAGVAFGDLDNDGDSDLIVPVDHRAFVDPERPMLPCGGPNQLLVNGGDGTFSEEGGPRGLVDPDGRRTACAALGDYDRDGFLDLYLCSWAMNSGVADNPDRLLHNRGAAAPGFFVDVAPPAGQTWGHGRDALVARWLDIDRDRWPDLYVGNVAVVDERPLRDPRDTVYRNRAGVDGDPLEDATAELLEGTGSEAWAPMGLAWGDIDNDGAFDLYITDFWDDPPLPYGNPLYLGTATGLGPNACAEYAVCTGYTGWPTVLEDFDRDGWVDLWVGTSGGPDHPDFLFVNRQGARFESHHVEAFGGHDAHGGASSDFDGDGDVDLFVWSTGTGSAILRAEPRAPGHWLELKLYGDGVRSNRDAIGAVATITTSGGAQRRLVSGGDSAHSQSDLVLHFGLGEADEVAQLDIAWPDGTDSSIPGPLAADQLLLVDQVRGLLPEELVEGEATWSATSNTLTVRAVTSYRGRTELSIGPVPLRWDPDALHFARVLPLPVAPGATVPLQSPRGTFALPVVVGP